MIGPPIKPYHCSINHTYPLLCTRPTTIKQNNIFWIIEDKTDDKTESFCFNACFDIYALKHFSVDMRRSYLLAAKSDKPHVQITPHDDMLLTKVGAEQEYLFIRTYLCSKRSSLYRFFPANQLSSIIYNPHNVLCLCHVTLSRDGSGDMTHAHWRRRTCRLFHVTGSYQTCLWLTSIAPNWSEIEVVEGDKVFCLRFISHVPVSLIWRYLLFSRIPNMALSTIF